MKVIAQGSDRGSPQNEDMIGHSADAVWLLDGATSLGPSRFDVSEARWLVEKVSAALETASGTIEDRLRSVIAAVRAEYETFGPVAAEAYAMPSAGLCWVRQDGDRLEIATLGDVKAWLIAPDGVRRVLGGGVLEALDAQSLEVLQHVQAERGPMDLKTARVWLDPVLRDKRALMNTEAGYWVLSLDPACLKGLEITRISVAEVTHILMATDGFYDLWKTYGVPFDEVFSDLLVGEGAVLTERLRAIERADPDGVTYPRFKTHDDASFVLIDLDSGANP
ncbi:protein phosphatase 2C domain-containing protein [Asticcacaulis sp. BYS171W]|uniref:Protein phosphatase 2C domain-containing protein n=1 Tax=Asticcacaulis aquaticus TaxID=2984212 RepID=A0ABT5HRC1_9CAUL|nr:protein phosphatase 2C domain-containing protein [Asticcacaulis aquaticus]MDC7682370.1 protein phosphatase 2C domain-containing protein [Asticcacaulis aquaticus]